MSDAPPPAGPQPVPPRQPVNVQPIQYSRGEYAATMPWNGLSIASLVLSIIGLSLLGVILGHIALSQIKRTGEQGYVLALIGVILGYLGLLAFIILGIMAVVALAAGAAFWTAYQ
jgi:peptidyl-prolyl cis-trans isomerase B (cyclophilin B)